MVALKSRYLYQLRSSSSENEECRCVELDSCHVARGLVRLPILYQPRELVVLAKQLC